MIPSSRQMNGILGGPFSEPMAQLGSQLQEPETQLHSPWPDISAKTKQCKMYMLNGTNPQINLH